MNDNLLLKDLRQRIVHQFIDLIILEKLKAAKTPKSGRYLINYVYRTFGVSVDDGLIFSLLLVMERKGWIRGRSKEVRGRIRRMFKVTTAGKEHLKDYLCYRDEVITFMKVLLGERPSQLSRQLS